MSADRPAQVQDLSGEIRPWDSDHTALVHVLWAARREGLTIDDFDRLTSKIMQSRWIKAVRLHAIERTREETP